MNRRTFLATTPLALAPRLPDLSVSDPDTKDDRDFDPPVLEDLLVAADELPADWTLGALMSGFPAQRDGDSESTRRGLRSRVHPRTDESVASTYAERRFITDSDLPPEFEHLDVALEVAGSGEDAPHDDRGEAIKTLHEVTFASETENWATMSTGWVDAAVSPATDQFHGRSIASIRKPLCAVPDGLELSTDKPLIEMAVTVVPLPWGTAVVTGTFTDPAEPGLTRRYVRRLASRAGAIASASPAPMEARQ
jgi:hypothetical protein